MKKTAVIILCAMLALSFSACAKPAADEPLTQEEFFESVGGVWLAAEGSEYDLCSYFITEDGEFRYALGEMYSEWAYSGYLTDFEAGEDNLYTLTIHCPAVEDSELGEGYDAFDETFTVDITEIEDEKITIIFKNETIKFDFHSSSL